MKLNDAFPGKYLRQDDFEPAMAVTIDRVVEETMPDGKEKEPVMYFRDPSRPVDVERGIVLNKTNWTIIMSIAGKDDSDEWPGTRIEVYRDPTISYGGKITGGIRVRAIADPGAEAFE